MSEELKNQISNVTETNNENEEKSNKKSLIVFILIMIGSLFGGFFTGFFASYLEVESFDQFVHAIMPVFGIVFPIALISINVILYLAAFVIYKKAKKLLNNLDYDDEATIEKIESLIDWPIILGNIAIVVNMISLGLGYEVTLFDEVDSRFRGLSVAASIAVLIIGFIIVLVLQQLAVGVEKKLNPEKKGNVYDTKFQKNWVESCDEAEKMMIYKSAYEAFKATNTTCTVLWIVSLIMQTTFETSPLPGVFVCIIYMVSIIRYSVAARKLALSK